MASQKNDGANDSGKEGTPPDVPATREEIDVVVIGDVYWDTVVVPLSTGKSDSNHLQPAYGRIVRAGGAWLLQSMIAAAATGKKITVHGYGEKKLTDGSAHCKAPAAQMRKNAAARSQS
jgi:hypothetical protein